MKFCKIVAQSRNRENLIFFNTFYREIENNFEVDCKISIVDHVKTNVNIK